MLSVCKKSLTVVISAACITSSIAQVNITPDVINFRDASRFDRKTNHYGNLQVSGDGTGANAGSGGDMVGAVINAKNNSTASYDRSGVFAMSTPAPHYGIGVTGLGGYIGVKANAVMSGSGTRYGLWATAYGGSGSNYGVFGQASGTNAYAGYFQGNVYTTGSYQSSDSKLKKNVANLSGGLDKVMKLSAKTYEYDDVNNPDMGLSKGKRIGLLAQDLEKVIPELVKDVPVAKPDKKDNPTEYIKAINYVELIPVLVNAIQEQQKEIEELKASAK